MPTPYGDIATGGLVIGGSLIVGVVIGGSLIVGIATAVGIEIAADIVAYDMSRCAQARGHVRDAALAWRNVALGEERADVAAAIDPVPARAAATHLICQISDTHLTGSGVPAYGAVDADANLRTALDMVVASGLSPDMLLLTGDLADDGHRAAYRRVRGLVAPIVEELGCPVLYLPGNHDDRATLADVLGDQHGDQHGDQRGTGTGSPVQQRTVRGLRVVGLDSTVPGAAHGHLAGRQLDELARILAQPAEHGTILALHHPPIHSPVAGIDAIGLRNPGDLADVIRGGDVRLIVAGHTHHAVAGALAGVPVWVSGACVYWSDALPERGRSRGAAGGQFSRIDVFPDGVVATAIPLGPHETVYEVPIG